MSIIVTPRRRVETSYVLRCPARQDIRVTADLATGFSLTVWARYLPPGAGAVPVSLPSGLTVGVTMSGVSFDLTHGHERRTFSGLRATARSTYLLHVRVTGSCQGGEVQLTAITDGH